jgi:predicted nucleic acid-binding protein
MNGKRAFADSNVPIYAYSMSDPVKQQKARAAILDNECVVSTQVLNEFCNVCLKKLRLPASIIQRDIKELVEICELVYIDEKTVQLALDIQARYGFSYYDSLVVASALENKCEYLFSEDLSDGQIIDGLIIKNIFKV